VSDVNRRPTKAERRERARLERKEIQQRIARRARTRRIGAVLVVIAVAAAVVAVVALGSGSVEVPRNVQALVNAAPRAAETAACDEVQTVQPYGPDDQTHVGGAELPTLPDLSTYPSTPPTSGPHEDGTVPAGVYDTPPPMGPLLHSLEHGAAVVWYDPDAPADELDRIKAFYEQDPSDVPAGQDRVIVAPYEYEAAEGAGRLPDGTAMALVAWHRLRTCGEPSLEVALDFTSRFAAPPALGREYQGEAPEAGGGI
jgi:hypothetical protein